MASSDEWFVASTAVAVLVDAAGPSNTMCIMCESTPTSAMDSNSLQELYSICYGNSIRCGLTSIIRSDRLCEDLYYRQWVAPLIRVRIKI